VRAFGHRSSGPFRGVKRDLWEGGHRVPFVVRWPGVVPAGRVSDALISQIDLFATIATAVGASIPAGSAEDSHDQTALLRGGETSARASLVHNTNEKGYAVRQGDWVLIDAPTGAVSKVPAWFDAENGYAKHDQPGELYNLREDPGQRRNLFAEQPAKVAELRAELQRIRTHGEVRPLAP
jgi:arylsulfatase A